MRHLLTALAATALLASTASAQCRGSFLGPGQEFVGSAAYAVSGNRIARVTAAATGMVDRVEIHELQPDGAFALVDVAAGFAPIVNFVQSMTFDGQRIQFIATGSPPMLHEVERDASGAWRRFDLPLSASFVRPGRILARDGDRFAALGVRDIRNLMLDVIERSASGRLEVVDSVPLRTRFASGHDALAGVDLDGDRIAVRSGAELRGAGQVVERDASGAWRRTGFLVQPPGSNGYYSGAVAVAGDVCATVRTIDAGTGTRHAVHVYERDSQSPYGWTLRQEILTAESAFAPGSFPYVHSVTLVDDRLVIGGVNRGVSQVFERAAATPLHFDPLTTIDGIGNDLCVSDTLIVGTSLDRDVAALTLADLAAAPRITVCLRAGVEDCVDAAHRLGLELWQRKIGPVQATLVAEVFGAGVATGAVLVGAPAFSPIPLQSGAFCIGADPRRSVIVMIPVGAGSFQASVPLTGLPAAGGTVSAIDGETWWFQAATTSGAPREFSSAVRIETRL